MEASRPPVAKSDSSTAWTGKSSLIAWGHLYSAITRLESGRSSRRTIIGPYSQSYSDLPRWPAYTFLCFVYSSIIVTPIFVLCTHIDYGSSRAISRVNSKKPASSSDEGLLSLSNYGRWSSMKLWIFLFYSIHHATLAGFISLFHFDSWGSSPFYIGDQKALGGASV